MQQYFFLNRKFTYLSLEFDRPAFQSVKHFEFLSKSFSQYCFGILEHSSWQNRWNRGRFASCLACINLLGSAHKLWLRARFSREWLNKFTSQSLTNMTICLRFCPFTHKLWYFNISTHCSYLTIPFFFSKYHDNNYCQTLYLVSANHRTCHSKLIFFVRPNLLFYVGFGLMGFTSLSDYFHCG